MDGEMNREKGLVAGRGVGYYEKRQDVVGIWVGRGWVGGYGNGGEVEVWRWFVGKCGGGGCG